MKHKCLLGLVAAAALACVASQAGAVTTIDATFETLNGVGDANISGTGVPGGSEGCSMGSMYFALNAVNAVPQPAGSGFTAYCVDIHDDIGWGQHDTWTLTDLADAPHGSYQMGTATAKLVDELFAEVSNPATLDAYHAAAFQAALWEVINPGLTVTCGEGNAVMGLANGANGYIADMDPSKVATDVYAIVSTDTQDFAFAVPNGADPFTGVVPEPITFLTGLMVVSGLGAYIRRRTRVAS
jgi:hypothetical protein